MIRILFCGFRHAHINSLYQSVDASDDFSIAFCTEENKEARTNAENTLGAVFADESYDTLLSEGSHLFDAVAIGGAYGDRGEAVIKALRAGKHVIADKPICTSLSELEEIRSLALEKGLVVACMLDLRYLPQSVRAKELLSSGMLGEVRNISFNGQHPLSYGKRPSWYFEKGMHGGTVNDIAIHGIDLIRTLTGLEFSEKANVRKWNSFAVREPHFKDSATLMARLENGAGVLADVSYSAPSQAFSLPSYWEFRFWCEKGMLTFNYVNDTVTVYKEGESTPTVYEGAAHKTGYLDEFLSDIKSGDLTLTRHTLRSQKTALLLESLAEE